MNALLARALARLAWPLRNRNVRLPLFERLMHCELTAAEAAGILQICAGMGRGFGMFYAWKLEQMALISTLRALDRAAVLALVERNDGSDYGCIAPILVDPRGLLITIPHHGHFVLSIVALCMQLRHQRDVFVFYDAPEIHASNEIFDVLHACLFGVENSGVTILHNNRAGIVRAVRELRAGQVVVIMPDVYRSVEDTYQLPFCGSGRNVMLGSAAMARRAGARILPVVSRVGPRQLHFQSAFGNAITPHPGGAGPHRDIHADFRTTMKVFARFETLMEDQLLYWQYAAGHVRREPLKGSTPEAILAAAPMFLEDPRIHVDVRSRLCLDD